MSKIFSLFLLITSMYGADEDGISISSNQSFQTLEYFFNNKSLSIQKDTMDHSENQSMGRRQASTSTSAGIADSQGIVDTSSVADTYQSKKKQNLSRKLSMQSIASTSAGVADSQGIVDTSSFTDNSHSKNKYSLSKKPSIQSIASTSAGIADSQGHIPAIGSPFDDELIPIGHNDFDVLEKTHSSFESSSKKNNNFPGQNSTFGEKSTQKRLSKEDLSELEKSINEEHNKLNRLNTMPQSTPTPSEINAIVENHDRVQREFDEILLNRNNLMNELYATKKAMEKVPQEFREELIKEEQELIEKIAKIDAAIHQSKSTPKETPISKEKDSPITPNTVYEMTKRFEGRSPNQIPIEIETPTPTAPRLENNDDTQTTVININTKLKKDSEISNQSNSTSGNIEEDTPNPPSSPQNIDKNPQEEINSNENQSPKNSDLNDISTHDVKISNEEIKEINNDKPKELENNNKSPKPLPKRPATSKQSGCCEGCIIS